VSETSGSYFPENEEEVTQHQFSDDALHHPGQTHSSGENNEISSRVSGIKSRIIQRAADKGNLSAES